MLLLYIIERIFKDKNGSDDEKGSEESSEQKAEQKAEEKAEEKAEQTEGDSPQLPEVAEKGRGKK